MNNNIQETPLLYRILFGGNDNNNIPIAPITHIEPIINNIKEIANITNIENIPIIYNGHNQILKGGNKDLVLESIYFQKINNLFMILFLSILIAIFIVKISDIINAIFKEDDPDSNFETDELIYKQRWKNIIKYTVIFITLIILVHVLIISIILLLFTILFSIKNKDQAISGFSIAKKKVIEMFWEYKDSKNNRLNLISYYILLSIVLIGMFLVFIIYTLLVKGYFTNIYYEKIYNESNDETEDKSQPQKYIYQYAIYLLIMMLFMLLLLNYTKLYDKKILFIYNIIIIIIYIILTLNIIRYQMTSNNKKFIIFLFLFIIIFIGYKYPLKLIAKYM